MNKVLVDTCEIHTSVGIFKHETTIYELSECNSVAENKLFFNGIECSDAQKIKSVLGDEDFEKFKSEVKKYSEILDIYMTAFPRIH